MKQTTKRKAKKIDINCCKFCGKKTKNLFGDFKDMCHICYCQLADLIAQEEY